MPAAQDHNIASVIVAHITVNVMSVGCWHTAHLTRGKRIFPDGAFSGSIFSDRIALPGGAVRAALSLRQPHAPTAIAAKTVLKFQTASSFRRCSAYLAVYFGHMNPKSRRRAVAKILVEGIRVLRTATAL